MHPREKRLRATLDYVNLMARSMGLRDWTFSVHEGCSPDAVADIEVTHGMRRAAIGFSLEFFERTPDVQRMYVCHELVHCHLENMEHTVSDALKPHVSKPLLASVIALHTNQNELATDSIARAWAPHLPLPKGLK